MPKINHLNRSAETPEATVVETLPVSSAQERMWFLQQNAPESPFYNVPLLLHLNGPLDISALERSLFSIEARHESLRTTFRRGIDTLQSQLNSPSRSHIPYTDLCELYTREKEQALDEIIEEEACKLFDLEKGPVWRKRLIRTSIDAYTLMLSYHHICVDDSSLKIVLKELGSYYRHFTKGERIGLPNLTSRYTDYALWQKQAVIDGKFNDQLKYWKYQLAKCPPTLEIPTDYPRPLKPSNVGDTETLFLSKSFLDRIEALREHEGTTLFMTLLGAFYVLLYRYSQQEDIVISSPIIDRPNPTFLSLSGLFLNTVALRLDLSDNPSFVELLKRIETPTIDGFSNVDVPFEMVVQELRSIDEGFEAQLTQIMFFFQSDIGKMLDLGNINAESSFVSTKSAKNELTLMTKSSAKGLEFNIEYSTDIFRSDTIKRMLSHLEQILIGIVDNPHVPIGKLKILPREEYQLVTTSWNNTESNYHSEKCIHHLFEDRVLIRPDSIAIVSEERTLTYEELNNKANQLARYLNTLGVEKDTLVGLSVSRSEHLVVGMLGILKAGGAYLFLDLTFPSKRLEFMLNDANVEVLVTQKNLKDQLPTDRQVLVCLDSKSDSISKLDTANLRSKPCPHSLAYTMYTSGSTGQPKGVEINHSSVVNFLTSMAIRPGLNPDDRIVAVTTPAFDISVLEIFLPLSVGASIEIVPTEVAIDAKRLAGLLEETTASVMQATPATWQMLLDCGWKGKKNLKVLCGGEALSENLAIELRKRCGELWNLYGPTETTVWSVITKVEEKWVPGCIGRPVANTKIFILDRNNEPTPIGVPGELYIGGSGLARDYRNRPSLTAEKFITNPFSEKSDSRLYRTGDLAKWLENGEVEFLGRIDDQVKLRGYRIELGEIESNLDRQAEIKKSVVLLREDRPGDKRLVAYLLANKSSAIDTTELKSRLKDNLPDYMVPVTFVTLQSFPLTPNGKVDRRTLPAPNESFESPSRHNTRPRTPIEDQLTSIWHDVLGKTLSIHDNFFDAGGHSILAVRVNVRASTVFQVNIPLRTLYDAPTIAKYAYEIEATRRAGKRISSRPPTKTSGILSENPPLSFGQQRLWLLEQIDGELTPYNIPLAWKLLGPLDTNALQIALNSIINRHDALRTVYILEGETPTQVVKPKANLNLDVISIVDQSNIAAEEIIRKEAIKRFDLVNEIPIRTKLIKVSENEHILMITMHRIASDGWSLTILNQELAIFYNAISKGHKLTIPSLDIQYSDFALWQQQEIQGQKLETLLDFWRNQLKGITALEFPTDRPRPQTQSYKGNLCAFRIPADLQDRLKIISRTDGVTLQMVLLAGFQILLARNSEQNDISVGTPVAGRNHESLEAQIGFFVNTLVLRTDLSGEPTVRELLNRVRETSLDAYNHQDLPFEKLVEELQPERHLGRSPLVQVLFQLMNFTNQRLELDGLNITALSGHHQRVRFDLEVYLWPTESGLNGELHYSTDLFEKDTIKRLLLHFISILEGIADNPESRIADLPIISEAESQQLLTEWNDTDSDYPRNKLIQQLFEDQATLSPDATAITSDSRRLNYRSILPDNMTFFSFDADEPDIPEGLIPEPISVPTSFAQERMWFLQQSAKDSPFYNLGQSLHIKGSLNLSALKYAIRKLDDVHESLRTTFYWEVDQLKALLQPKKNSSLRIEDISSLSTHERKSKLSILEKEEVERIFDLKNGPVWRQLLVKLGTKEFVLIMSFHHICVDEWSLAILLDDFSKFYRSFETKNGPQEKPLLNRYTDYALWQKKQVSDGKVEAQIDYWCKQLGSNFTELNLPTDHPRPPVSTNQGSSQELLLSRSLLDQVEALGIRNGVTLYMTLLAAFQILLHRYTGQDNVTVGTPIANRPLPEFQTMTGLMLNTLAIKTDLNNDPSVSEMLHRVRNCALDAYENQDAPFEQVIQRLRSLGLDSENQLFRVMFTVNQEITRNCDFGTLDVSSESIEIGIAKHDLTLFAKPTSSNLELKIQYRTDLFEPITIERMLGHLGQILEEMVKNQETSINKLPLLTPGEKEEIIYGWNQSKSDYPDGACIHHLFETHAEQHPDSIALVTEEQELTYKQLEERANQLANFLQKQGVKPQSRIGICIERSIDMVVGILATLKAGGIYVPLDPNYPEERLLFMLEDASVEIVLAHASSNAKFPSSINLIELDSTRQTILRESASRPRPCSQARDLAYIIYTSGSSGTPKGVCVEHRSVNRLVMETNYADFGNDEVFLLMAPLTFDASTFELWAPLLNGARLVIFPPGQTGLREIADVIKQRNITTLWLTAGLFHLIVDECLDDLKPLRQLIAGGDVLSLRHVKKAKLALPNCKIINGYGPTEGTTFSCFYRIPNNLSMGTSVPIGRPISNTTVYILDANLQPVPVGIPGELYIGGDGLARGYLNQPNLTANSFLQVPIDGDSRSLLYKTGDWVRYLPDGNIEFLGRRDKQVKIRGYRIEAGEIETHLQRHPSVKECIVETQRDSRQENQIVAYLVFETSGSENRVTAANRINGVSRWSKSSLPKFMVPAAFVELKELPLTSNGKVDRQSLPNPLKENSSINTAPDKPLTALQQNMHEIWLEVLKVNSIEIDANFFEIGGHSLLAANLASKLEQRLELNVSIASVFQYPTIAELSSFLEDKTRLDTLNSVNFEGNLSLSDSRPPLFCIHFLDSSKRLSKYMRSNYPVHGIDAPLKEELRSWHTTGTCDLTLENLAKRCLNSIRHIQPSGPYHLAGFCFGGVLAFEIANQLTDQNEQVRFLGLLDATYAPGCDPVRHPRLNRLLYHGKRVLRSGHGYIWEKLNTRIATKKRRREQLKHFEKSDFSDSEAILELPQAALLGSILTGYKIESYPNSAVLLRTVLEPLSHTRNPGKYNGWDKVINGALTVIDFPCGHLEISEEPYIQEVAKCLDKQLEKLTEISETANTGSL